MIKKHAFQHEECKCSETILLYTHGALRQIHVVVTHTHTCVRTRGSILGALKQFPPTEIVCGEALFGAPWIDLECVLKCAYVTTLPIRYDYNHDGIKSMSKDIC